LTKTIIIGNNKAQAVLIANMSSDEEDDDWAFFDEENIFGDREEDDVDEVDTRIPGADHVLVLLDCDPAMFETTFPVDGDDASEEERKMMTPMDASLKVLEEHVRASVRNTVENKTGKRNGFGLKLFGKFCVLYIL
jgi:hypothetical protein